MKRRIVLWWSAAIAIVLVIVGLLLWSRVSTPPEESPGGSDSSTSAPSPLPTVAAPTPASSADPGVVEGNASELVIPFVSAESASRTDGSKAVDFSGVATGDALDDLQVNAMTLAENGQVQIGSPQLVSANVTQIDTSASPPAATVAVCLDYSEVDIRTTDGTSLKDPKSPQRVPSILVLNQVDGRWLVAKRTFPESPTC